eukprot:2527102-Pleurochrysis_carterae.AAC.1
MGADNTRAFPALMSLVLNALSLGGKGMSNTGAWNSFAPQRRAQANGSALVSASREKGVARSETQAWDAHDAEQRSCTKGLNEADHECFSR